MTSTKVSGCSVARSRCGAAPGRILVPRYRTYTIQPGHPGGSHRSSSRWFRRNYNVSGRPWSATTRTRSRCGGRDVAGYKSAARDLGAFICLEDEAGQGLSPPKGRTWARRPAGGAGRGAGGGRVSIAGAACYRPGDRPHLFYVLRAHCRRKGEARGLTWPDYRDLIIATHHLSAPLVVVLG